MSDRANPPRLPWPIAAVAMIAFMIAGLIGGPTAAPDVELIRTLGAERAAHPALTSLAITVTNIGGASGMIAILVVVIGVLAFQRRWKKAAVFGGIVLGGRIVVELLKLLVDRPRPSFGPYPVSVSSLSFPSAHAANSMITFLAIATLIIPARFRVIAVTAAVSLSVLVGGTRPFLGVHWPSDVVGGWAFGIAWVVMLARASGYWLASDEFRSV